jgi:hypothetical protein
MAAPVLRSVVAVAVQRLNPTEDNCSCNDITKQDKRNQEIDEEARSRRQLFVRLA